MQESKMFIDNEYSSERESTVQCCLRILVQFAYCDSAKYTDYTEQTLQGLALYTPQICKRINEHRNLVHDT